MLNDLEINSNLREIGNEDSQVRESVLNYWHQNREQNNFTVEQYKYLLSESLKKINDFEKSILVRSYSLLLVDCILQADLEKDILSNDERIDIVKKLIKYMKAEHDFRGFDPKYGWIHTLAHLSDCIYTLSKIIPDNYCDLLINYLQLIDTAKCKYYHLEDERIARALAEVPESYQDQVNIWITTRANYLEKKELDLNNYLYQVSKYRLIYKALLRYETYTSQILGQLNSFY